MIENDDVFNSIIFQKSDRPIPVKLIGNLVDTSQVVMSILLDFLTNEVDRSGAEMSSKSAVIFNYAASLPVLADLLDMFKLDIASAFMLCRPLMRAAQVMVNAGNVIDAKLKPFLRSNIPRTLLHTMVSESSWKQMSPELFEIFFATSLYDIFCPSDVYESEIARLERETERLSNKKNAPPITSIQPGTIPEKSDHEEYERVKQMVSGLKIDFSEQKIHAAKIQDTIVTKIPDFFVSDQVSSAAAMVFFVRCIYPRCMLGPDDAMFCAHFVSLLHQNATPGFSTLHYFDALIQIIPRSLYCLTEGEAACASILLLETWKIVSKWRYDDAAFESELIGKPGSFLMDDVENDAVAISKESYEKLYNKWHAAIGDTLVGCLQSKEYMHLRCGLLVLTRIVDEYPTRPKLANSLLVALEPLTKESNVFADIRASSQAYSMQLLRSRDNGVWKEEDVATVQARLAMVEAAAAERHKKAEEQMAQIKRDSEKITEEIGVSETRTRGRGPTLFGSSADDRSSRNSAGNESNRRRLPVTSGTPEDSARTTGGTNTSAGGSNSFSSYASIAPAPPPVADSSTGGAGRTLEGRWQHATISSTASPARSAVTKTATSSTSSTMAAKGGGSAVASTTRKRSRPSSPSNAVEPGETTSTKRDESSSTGGTATKRSKSTPSDDNKRQKVRHAGTRRI
jgi:Transcription factor/nuclear export subunit protein 2